MNAISVRLSSLIFYIFFISALSANPLQYHKPWTVLNTLEYKGKRDDISFVDENIGWYGTGKGELFSTRDGGETWTLIKQREGTFIRAVNFVSENTGFIGNIGTEYYPGVTDETPLYSPDDGGITWQAVDTGATTIKGVCAIDVVSLPNKPHIIHAAGRVGGPVGLLRSLDGGKSCR